MGGGGGEKQRADSRQGGEGEMRTNKKEHPGLGDRDALHLPNECKSFCVGENQG